MNAATQIAYSRQIEWGMGDLNDAQVLDVLSQPWGEFVACPRCLGTGREATTYERDTDAWNDESCSLCGELAEVPAFVAEALVLDRLAEIARQEALKAATPAWDL